MISLFVRWARQRWQAYSQRPSSRLVRLFVGRIFHGGAESAQGDLDVSLGLILSLLALPGGFYALFLLEKYATLLRWIRGQADFDPLAAALPDEYFFIVLSMVVTGVVAVWRWDSIFPDRRDYANLVALPISTPTIFAANLAAIVLLALVLAIDVNAASALLFPFVVSASENAFGFFAHFVFVHAFVVVLASIFSFFAVFTTVGVLMVALPYATFRRVSMYLRVIIILGLVAMLSTSFAVPSSLHLLPRTYARFLPPVWFLGLCQLVRGRAGPPLALLGKVALTASAVLIPIAVALYAISYRRCFVRIPETADATPTSRRGPSNWMLGLLDRTILHTPFQRATYRFAITTLFRSEHHALVLGGFFGLAIVTASQFLFASFNGKAIEAGSIPSPEVLAIPLILSYCAILGVRFVFDISTELQANWLFRLCLDKSQHECVPLARKVMLSFVLPWLVLVALPLYAALWGWHVGLLTTFVTVVWSLLFAELLLLRFRKVPFTCSYPPFRDSAVVLVLSYILGFFVFVVLTANLEYWALLNPFLMIGLIVVPILVCFVLSGIHRGTEEVDKELIFEESAPAAVELLNLGRGS